MRINRLHTEGTGVVGCVCRDICPFDALVLYELVRALYIFSRGTIGTIQHTEPTHTAQDSHRRGVQLGWGYCPR